MRYLVWCLALVVAAPAAAQRTDSPLAQPPSDETMPGVGPVRRADWFGPLWLKRRTAFAAETDARQNALVFLGDSITQGWDGLSDAFNAPAVANRGISGDTTRGMLSRLPGDVLGLNPAGVVFLGGTNDLEMGGEPADIAANVADIIDAIQEHAAGTPVVLCLVMPSDESKKRPADLIRDLNDRLREVAAYRPQVTVLDTYSLFAGPDGNATADLFPDLLHPNEAGYAVWKTALTPTLEMLGLVPTEVDEFTPEPGFRSLFNGTDLTGWGFRPLTGRMKKGRERLLKLDTPWANWPDVPEAVTFDNQTQSPDGRFTATNGRIVVRPVPEGRRIQQLWTTEEFASDFELRLQFRAAPNADSGVFIRYPQLQVRDYPRAGPYKDLASFRPLEWNDLTVVVTGNTARCTCNGEVLGESLELPETGPIGLEGDRGLLEYRRIRVRTGEVSAKNAIPRRPAAAGGQSYRDESTGLRFPPAIGDLTFQSRHAYEDPELGFSVFYRGGGLVADVYVYRGGVADIPDGPDSDLARREVQQADDAIRYQERQGVYQNVRRVVEDTPADRESDETDASGDGRHPPGAWASAKYRYSTARPKGQWEGVISETYVRGYRGRFLKFRLTYPAAGQSKATEARDRLLTFFADQMAAE